MYDQSLNKNFEFLLLLERYISFLFLNVISYAHNVY
jgi:hypothetical protein